VDAVAKRKLTVEGLAILTVKRLVIIAHVLTCPIVSTFGSMWRSGPAGTAGGTITFLWVPRRELLIFIPHVPVPDPQLKRP
jgi:hypothetical protein